MKKIKVGVFAGVIALLMAFSSANTVAMADEAATKGNVVIQDEGWDAESAPEPVVLNNVTAKEIIVESGSQNVLKINGGKIETVSVVAPKLEKMGYEEIVALLKLGMPAEEVADMYQNYLVARKEINRINPTIQVEKDAVIEAVAVSGGVFLNMEGGDVKEIIVNNNNNPEMITITIQNYDGKVTVDQKENADGTANQLTVKLVNSNLSELSIKGEDDCSCSIQGDKVSNVAAVDVNGSIYMVMNVPATDMVIAENAKKSSVRVYNKVENVVINADNCDFSVAADAKVTNAVVEGDNVKVRYTGTLDNVKVNGAGSDVKYAKITPLPIPTATPKPTKKPKPEDVKPEGTIIGQENCSTAWWTAFTNTVKVEEGETKSVTFWNYTSGQENWHNFAVILQNVANAHGTADNGDYLEYAAVRADHYGWGAGYGSATLESIWNWDTFKTDMQGAKVELSVTNNGDTADVKADITTKSGKQYYQNYLGITTGGDLYFCLTVEGGYLIVEDSEDFPGTPETPEEPEITETPEEPEITEAPEEPEGIVIGNTDCSTAFGTVFSDMIKVAEGETKTVIFKNYTNGLANWNNFAVVLKDEARSFEYAIVRADHYGWGAGYDGIATPESNWNWDTFTTVMNGATVEVSVTNHGETADVIANITAENGAEHFQKYLGIALDGELSFCLTVEGGYLVIEEMPEESEEPEPTPEPTPEPEEPTGTVIGNTDCSTAWGTAFSDAFKVEVGETETITFKNYTNGLANWNNFAVVLKDEARNIDYAVVRADHYGWGAGYEGIATPESNWNWDTFTTVMNGATVELSVTNHGTTADVVANITAENGAEHFQKYLGIALDGELSFLLTIEGGYLVLE